VPGSQIMPQACRSITAFSQARWLAFLPRQKQLAN
jgi:hypothetical protein